MCRGAVLLVWLADWHPIACAPPLQAMGFTIRHQLASLGLPPYAMCIVCSTNFTANASQYHCCGMKLVCEQCFINSKACCLFC